MTRRLNAYNTALTDQIHALIGAARFAYLVFPPAWQYILAHPYALHLWARWDDTDGAALPDFVGSWFARTGELSV